MRRFASFFAALAIVAGAAPLVAATAAAQDAPAPAAPAAGTVTLTVTFTGIKSPTGAVMLGLYDSEKAYGGGKAVRQVMVPVSGDTAATTIEGLPPGQYAIKAFHDVDGDGKMGTNPFGIPTEPYAFSNDAKGAMGPAKWAAAMFEVSAPSAEQTVHID